MSLIFLNEYTGENRTAWVFKNEVGFAFTVQCFDCGQQQVQDVFHSLVQAEQFAREWCRAVK